jgi:glutathione S-transferase
MKLHHSPTSPFVRKVMMAVHEFGLEGRVELLAADVWGSDKIRADNPLGKVPALQLDDGRVLVSSPLIGDYVDSKHPDPRFIPEDLEGRIEVRRWEALADGVMDSVAAVMYEARFHDEATRSKDWFARQQKKWQNGFAALEGMLGDREWCVGSHMTLADIAVGCHLGFIGLRVPQYFPTDRYPRLARLWRKLEARDSFRKTAPPKA